MTARTHRSRLEVGEGGVDATRSVTSIVILLMSAAFVAPAHAQDPPQPNLLFELSRPSQSISIDSSTRDDLKDRPAPPRADPLREPFRVYVGVGDQRCLPGEDGLDYGPVGRGARRRSR
jgi:hypothetical protein